LSLRILADESVDYRIVKALRNKDFEVISVVEGNPGIPDKDVIDQAKDNNALLLTEDSDFGEWVFVHKVRNISVIFLRYKTAEIDSISDSLVRTLIDYGISLSGKFVVITVNKIRIREAL
jgi:predicted nuclease of predicted toxin-antitoxin system